MQFFVIRWNVHEYVCLVLLYTVANGSERDETVCQWAQVNGRHTFAYQQQTGSDVPTHLSISTSRYSVLKLLSDTASNYCLLANLSKCNDHGESS